MGEISYRNLRADDFEDLSAIARDWPVVRQLGGWAWPYDAAQIRDRCAPYDKGDGFVWAICEDDRLIGTIGVVAGDLGYALRRDRHGRGIIGPAARHAIATAFAGDTHDHLTATTWGDNTASHKVLLRLGFAHWQSRFQHALARGVPTQSRGYRLSRTDWLALEKPGSMA